MFEQLGALAGIMKNLPKIQAGMAQMQERIGQIVAEGSAGGDEVVAQVNGKMQLLSLKIAPALIAAGDGELIEQLVLSATNSALDKVREELAADASKMAADIGIPPGMLPPGMGGMFGS